jgi:hypothetical protein
MDLDYIKKVISNHLEDGTIFVFKRAARVLLEQVDVSTQQQIVSMLRSKYRKKREVDPVISYFDTNKLNVAIHIRRGKDVRLDKLTAWRYTENQYYINIIKNLNKALPLDIEYHIYSEGNAEEFEEFAFLPNTFVHLCPWPPSDYKELFKTFHHMVSADILITATSEFSYFLGWMNPNYILTLPAKSVVKFPISDRFASTKIDGSFEEERLRNHFLRNGKIILKKGKINYPRSFRAYIRTDSLENPEVLSDLYRRLLDQDILPLMTDKQWQDIDNEGNPFLYFRNAYLRFGDELKTLRFHYQQDFPYIKLKDDEVISCNPTSKNLTSFIAAKRSDVYQPKIKPLPVLVVARQKSIYFKLTVNSILHNTKGIPDQEIYILADSSNREVETEILELLERDLITGAKIMPDLDSTAVILGSKYFNLGKFIYIEGGTILPDSLHHVLPCWTRQLNYRSTTAELVAFRISDQNRCKGAWIEDEHRLGKYITPNFEEGKLWNYIESANNHLSPVGRALVIDSKKVAPNQHIQRLYYKAKSVCVVNIPLYNMEANKEMD